MYVFAAMVAALIQTGACPAPCTSEIALVVALDTTVAATDRARALAVVRAAPRREAVTALVALARPYRQPWIVWQSAMRALQAHQFPEAAPFWREMLGFPRRTVREAALRGIAVSGNQDDVMVVRAAVRHETDSLLLRLAEIAERQMQRRR